MTTTAHHPDLDHLTDALPSAADQLSRRLDRLVTVAGRDRPQVCPWCLEDTGQCEATGGNRPCEGHDEAALAAADAVTAPTIHIRTGGARCS